MIFGRQLVCVSVCLFVRGGRNCWLYLAFKCPLLVPYVWIFFLKNRYRWPPGYEKTAGVLIREWVNERFSHTAVATWPWHARPGATIENHLISPYMRNRCLTLKKLAPRDSREVAVFSVKKKISDLFYDQMQYLFRIHSVFLRVRKFRHQKMQHLRWFKILVFLNFKLEISTTLNNFFLWYHALLIKT